MNGRHRKNPALLLSQADGRPTLLVQGSGKRSDTVAEPNVHREDILSPRPTGRQRGYLFPTEEYRFPTKPHRDRQGPTHDKTETITLKTRYE